MSYDSKLMEARELLSNHFSQLNKDTADPEVGILVIREQVAIQVDSFFKKLRAAGGTDDESLKLCKYEDLESFGSPRLLAKRIADIFRRGGAEKEVKPLKASSVSVMSVRQLLEHYDPREPNAVSKRLSEIVDARGNQLGPKRCIVFNSDNSVNIDASEKLVQEIRDGYDEREGYAVAGTPVKVYPIGQRPGLVVDENPLYPGRALRPDGDCDQTNRSWDGISLTIRQLVYLAITQTKEIKMHSLMDAHNILDLVVAHSQGGDVLGMRFSKAAIRYKELQDQGALPSLKLSRSSSPADAKNNPFGQHKQF